MISVGLTDGEWQQVLGILSMAPWRDANPLLMKIGEQLRLHQQAAQHLEEGVKMPGGNSAAMSTLKQ